MKKFILVISILIVINPKLFPQWSTDPNNNLIIGYGLNPELCSDSSGGCYITYEVGYPSEIYLHRLDKYGYQPWGDNRIIAGELDEQSDAEIIEDGEGGVIVSYGDHILHERYKLRIQKVDSSGNFLWGSTGVKPSITPAGSGTQKLVADGDGGCVIVWTDTLDQYRINRIDRFGQRVWGDSGLYIQSDYNSTPPNLIRASDGNYYVQIRYNLYRISKNGDIVLQDSTTLTNIVPDPEGGVVQSGRVWSGLISKLVAQRRDSLGNHLWQEPYVEIADSLFINTQLSINYNNIYFFGWTSNKNGIESQPYLQGLREDGTELFVNGGMPLSNSSTTITSFIPIIPSDNKSNIYIWTQWINQPSSTGNFAKRVDTLGTQIWGNSAVLLNSPALRHLGVTNDCSGGAIGTGYLNEDFAIKVFKISANGKLGEIITDFKIKNSEFPITKPFLFQNYPNPFNSKTTINYQIYDEGRVKLSVYNILGEQLQILIDEFQRKGHYSKNFNSGNLPSGVYLYTLETNNKVLTNKLTILK